jgi:type VI protein secretion system component VasF
LIARLPALWGSAYIGANLQEKNYLPVWIVSGIALVLFVLGMIFKDKIIGLITKLRHRRSA